MAAERECKEREDADRKERREREDSERAERRDREECQQSLFMQIMGAFMSRKEQ